jgi:hypothetical protein
MLNHLVTDHLNAPFLISLKTPVPPAGDVTVLVTLAILGSSKVRLGPMPEPSSLAAINAIVAKAIDEERPIPLLMPWGSKKPDNGTVDVAELGAFKTLSALQERVKLHYAPGIELRMRIEDLSGDYLFKEEGEAALNGSALYLREFRKLLFVLGLPFVTPLYETLMMDPHVYNALVDELRPVFMRYIRDIKAFGIVDDPSLESYRQLSSLGWKGFIPSEQRNFYTSRYMLADPSMTDEAADWKLSGYLASILGRIRLRGYGSEDWGKDFINLSFAPPVPGTPPAFAERRVYYRTLPEQMSRTHIPPWRARGYLRVERDRVLTKIASWHEDLDLQPETVTLSRDFETVTVRAPQLLVQE